MSKTSELELKAERLLASVVSHGRIHDMSTAEAAQRVAAAQAYATLALVEQQRVANMIAAHTGYSRLNPMSEEMLAHVLIELETSS